MKQNKKEKASVTAPLLQKLINYDKARQQSVVAASPELENCVPAQPDLYQDLGGAYYKNFTFPQESLELRAGRMPAPLSLH